MFSVVNYFIIYRTGTAFHLRYSKFNSSETKNDRLAFLSILTICRVKDFCRVRIFCHSCSSGISRCVREAVTGRQASAFTFTTLPLLLTAPCTRTFSGALHNNTGYAICWLPRRNGVLTPECYRGFPICAFY